MKAADDCWKIAHLERKIGRRRSPIEPAEKKIERKIDFYAMCVNKQIALHTRLRACVRIKELSHTPTPIARRMWIDRLTTARRQCRMMFERNLTLAVFLVL